jgi:hypothetical protein
MIDIVLIKETIPVGSDSTLILVVDSLDVAFSRGGV